MLELAGTLLLSWALDREKKGKKKPVKEEREFSWARDIKFDPGDPIDWDSYIGQERAKEVLKLILATAHHNHHPRIMFAGPKGLGKTSIFRIFAKYYIGDRMEALQRAGMSTTEGIGGRYIETTPAMIHTKADLDHLMANIQLWDVIAIDEIHMLPRDLADILLPAIEDNLYPFDDGMRELPEDFVWIGATTDVGLLPEAFRDRFQIVDLEFLNEDDLTKVVMLQPMPIDEDAAREIARRSAGYPREVKRIYARARDVAIARGRDRINFDDAQEAFRILDLDQHGLYKPERAILETLYYRPKYYAPRKDGTVMKRFAQSERTIRTITGLDENYYKELEAKLLRMGYLNIGSGGRELTQKALDTYFRGL